MNKNKINKIKHINTNNNNLPGSLCQEGQSTQA